MHPYANRGIKDTFNLDGYVIVCGRVRIHTNPECTFSALIANSCNGIFVALERSSWNWDPLFAGIRPFVFNQQCISLDVFEILQIDVMTSTIKLYLTAHFSFRFLMNTVIIDNSSVVEPQACTIARRNSKLIRSLLLDEDKSFEAKIVVIILCLGCKRKGTNCSGKFRPTPVN